MSTLEMLSSQQWVERLGWTLIHFLWQGLLIAVLYAAARRGAFRNATPNARYLLACAALTTMMLAPLATWSLMAPARPVPSSVITTYGVPAASPDPTAANITLPPSVRDTLSGVQSPQYLPYIVLFWFTGAMVFWTRLAGGLVIAARMRSVRVRSAPPEWQHALKELSVRIGLSASVRLLVSALVEAPVVVGWLRPVVLVPVGVLSGLPVAHLEALLLHELAHIKRRDYLVNILQSAAEALLFYHPAIWWVSGHIRAERELCCDDVAVSIGGDVLSYARALAQLELSRPAPYAAAAANGGSLADRIARLLGQPRPSVRSGLGPCVLALAILLVTAAVGLFGQSGANSAFQAVSIKRNTANWSEPTHHPMGVGLQPTGMNAANASLRLLIQFAYADHASTHSLPLPASVVVGGPEWIGSIRYDIAAQSPSNANPAQSWTALQALLADRFKLKLHRETRELPVYQLAAAMNGVKMPAAKEVDCVSFPPGTPPRHVPGKVDCGYVSGPFSEFGASHLRLTGSKVRIMDLIKELTVLLDRPVLDKTGFKSEFDLNLIFTRDTSLMGLPRLGGPRGSTPPTDSSLPSLPAALEQQLGLKLAPAKHPIEVLVIDHAEQPVEN